MADNHMIIINRASVKKTNPLTQSSEDLRRDREQNSLTKKPNDIFCSETSVFLEKSMSESSLDFWIQSKKSAFGIPAKTYGKSVLVSRGIYKYKNPIDEVFPTETIRSQNSTEVLPGIVKEHKSANKNTEPKNPDHQDQTQNKPSINSAPTQVINEEGEIIQGAVISPLVFPPRSKCVFIGDFTRECVFNALRISRKWDHPLKYVIGFHSYFIKSCCQMLKSHINQFTSCGAFINGAFPELLERVKRDLQGQNYCLCVDISSNEELALVEPLLRNAGSYIICSKLPMLSRLASYADYLFVSQSAGVSKVYEANLRKKSMCNLAQRNMLRYSMGYKLSILAYYLDKLEENEYIVAVNPFGSISMKLWYLPYWRGYDVCESNAFYYPIGCLMGYFSSGGNSHRKTLKSYYVKNYRAVKMQTVIMERGNPLSFLYKEHLPKDIFLVIFELAF